MNHNKNPRSLMLQFTVGMVLLCLGFAALVYSIWTTANYHFPGFALMGVGAWLVGRGLAMWLRVKP